MAGDRRMRHGASEGLRASRLRSGGVDRLGVRLRHRADRDDPLRHQRHPAVLRKRRAVLEAVLADLPNISSANSPCEIMGVSTRWPLMELIFKAVPEEIF